MILGLVLVGGVAAFDSRRWTTEQRVLGRFVAVYSLVLSVVYAAIPYKTPWCLLNFYHGYLVMAGFGAWSLVTMPKRRWIGVFAGFACWSGLVIWQCSPGGPTRNTPLITGTRWFTVTPRVTR